VLWFILDGASLDWHGVATLAVWFMTLLIQRTEHRDTQARQAKLDELLHANRQANNALTKIDEQEPEDIVRHWTEARAAAKILIQKVTTMALIHFDGAGPVLKHRSYLEPPCHRERSSDLGRPVPQRSPF
jgi:low affinity Fe/Cu permease